MNLDEFNTHWQFQKYQIVDKLTIKALMIQFLNREPPYKIHPQILSNKIEVGLIKNISNLQNISFAKFVTFKKQIRKPQFLELIYLFFDNFHIYFITINIIYQRKMQIQNIQKELSQNFKEFSNKNNLIQYYVCFQFPQRQKTLAIWWKQKIRFVLEKMQDVYVSPLNLKIIFTMHGLKPIPLEALLKYYEENGEVIWRQKTIEQNKGFFAGMKYYLWGSDQNKTSQIDDDKSKVTIKAYRDQKIDQLIRIVKQYEQRNGPCIEYNHVEEQATKNLKICKKALQTLIQELNTQGRLVFQNLEGQKLIIYSKFTKQRNNSEWVQIIKKKYQLKMRIQDFTRKIIKASRQIENLTLKAKEQITPSNKNYIKSVYLNPVMKLKKSIQALSSRKTLLSESLYSLQAHQNDSKTIEMLQSCDKLLKKSLKQPEEVDNILMKTRQTRQKQQQMNEQFRVYEVQNNDQEGIDDMLLELENQIKRQRPKKQLPKISEKRVNVQIIQKENQKRKQQQSHQIYQIE